MTMNHEQTSELLRPYLDGKLDEGRARDVEEHLGECAECRLELTALRALLAEQEPMSELERTALHGRIRANVEFPNKVVPETRRMAWLPPALGVAAMLLLVVIGVQVVGGGGDLEGAGDGSAAEGETSGALKGPRPVTLELSAGGVRKASVATEDVQEATGDGSAENLEDDTAVSEDGAAPDYASVPRKEGAMFSGSVGVEAQIKGYARTSPTFTRFAAAYTVDDVEALQDTFIQDLAADAPVDVSAQVTECARLVVEGRSYPTLPVAAAHGRFKGEDALLLGFVWTPEESGSLDSYVLYVWPLGNCSTPTHSQSGRIRVAKS